MPHWRNVRKFTECEAATLRECFVTYKMWGCRIEWMRYNSWDMRLPHRVYVMWDGDASLEAQGIITAVMMLNGIFEWIAWRYGVLNGLQADMDTVWIWIWLREVVKNYSIPLLGSRWDDAIFYYQKELRIWDMGMTWRNPGSGFWCILFTLFMKYKN